MNATEIKKFITICYLVLLDREPTKRELTYWQGRILRDKLDELDIIYEFVTSKEFKKGGAKE